MTAKQWRLLEILQHHGDPAEGTMEVLLAWGDYDFGDSPEQEAKGWNVTRLVVAGLMRTLVAKGLALDDEWGYGITEKGKALLARRRARQQRAEAQQ
jgi:hypothetical protein